MKTQEQIPWAAYLVIDDDTLETQLTPDTPDDIREAYRQYQEDIRKHTELNTPIFK